MQPGNPARGFGILLRWFWASLSRIPGHQQLRFDDWKGSEVSESRSNTISLAVKTCRIRQEQTSASLTPRSRMALRNRCFFLPPPTPPPRSIHRKISHYAPVSACGTQD